MSVDSPKRQKLSPVVAEQANIRDESHVNEIVPQSSINSNIEEISGSAALDQQQDDQISLLLKRVRVLNY